MSKHHARPIDVRSIGNPTVTGAGGRWLVELAAISDDTKRARLLRLTIGLDASDLRALFASARAAGFTE